MILVPGDDLPRAKKHEKRQCKKKMEKENMPWQQWLSPDKNKTMQKFLFSGIPALYIVDKEGKIMGSYTGFTENVKQKIDQKESLFNYQC